MIAQLGAQSLLFARTVRAVRHRRPTWQACLFQIFDMAHRSAWLVVGGMAFFGAVMVTLANDQARRLTGNVIIIGPAFFELLVRELGPLTAALLAGARVGGSTAAELSAMVVNEQVEALEMSAGDPLSDLVAPRVVASAVAVPLLSVLGCVAASGSAALTAVWGLGVDGLAFIDPRFVDTADWASGGLKAVLCGIYIPVAAAHHGFAAQGGAPAVGMATTAGAVNACLGCLVIDFLLTLALYLVGM